AVKKAPVQKAQAAKKHVKKAPAQKAQAAKKHHKTAKKSATAPAA
ncbi:TPA: acid-shock protein, partial [Yersinia enterocolitica]